MTISILGGTGHEGSGLAMRWAIAGHNVILGSRTIEKAERVASELNERIPAAGIVGMQNNDAAAAADIAVLTVPYSAHNSTLEHVRDNLQGKILVDVTVPLVPPQITVVNLPEGISASSEAQVLLGEGVRVVSAFQNISAVYLKDPEKPIESDVFVCGDDRKACEEVLQLAVAAGMHAWYVGPLANSVAVESLTPLLLGLGRQFRRLRVGVQITGLPRERITSEPVPRPAPVKQDE